ncbi:MAG: hypothetical protein J7L20_01865 [Thermoplasmata archaeon]|nr:hypothetical protein [Thermoplasmata archaeon]
MRLAKFALVTVTILIFLAYPLHGVVGNENDDYGENLSIKGEIPPIKIGEDTVIDLYYEDFAGLNWTYLLQIGPAGFRLLPGGMALFLTISPLYKSLRDALCYHTIEFSAYVTDPEGKNLSGWYAVIVPSKVEGSTQGRKFPLKLIVRIDGTTTYPKAIVVVKAVRRGKEGKILDVEYHSISVKAEHIYLLDVKPEKTVLETTPGSTVSIPITITNRGNYAEVYHIEAEGKNGLSPLSGSQFFVINPGESLKVSIDVVTPFSLIDPGTPRSVEIKAFPVGKPDQVFIGSVSIVTKGINLVTVSILILIAVLIFALVKLLTVSLRHGCFKRQKELEKTIEDKSKEEVTQHQETSRQSVLEEKISQILKEQEKQKRKLNI